MAETFKDWLDQVIERYDLDSSHVAARANISAGYLSMLRRGQKEHPSRRVVEAIAVAIAEKAARPRDLLLRDAFLAAGLPTEEPARSLPFTVPKNTSVDLVALSRLWEEGERRSTWLFQEEKLGIRLRVEVYSSSGPHPLWLAFRLEEISGRSPSVTGCSVRWSLGGQSVNQLPLSLGQSATFPLGLGGEISGMTSADSHCSFSFRWVGPAIGEGADLRLTLPLSAEQARPGTFPRLAPTLFTRPGSATL